MIFSIDLTVDDEQELFAAAIAQMTEQGVDRDDALWTLQPHGVIDARACVQMLLDPGLSPPGTSINESWIES